MHKVRNILFFTTYSAYMFDEVLLFLISWEIALQGLLWRMTSELQQARLYKVMAVVPQ